MQALASAVIAAPPEGAIPPGLDQAVRDACTNAWRAVEIVLAGEVLRGRLGKTRDTYVRDAVEAVLALVGGTTVRPDALAELREARRAGELAGDLDIRAIVAMVRASGAAAVGRGAVAAVRRELAHHDALEAALGEHELGALLVDAARALFRQAARDPELARWAIGPTGITQRDRALVAFAELVASQPSLDELETLIALPIHLDENVQFTVYRPRSIDPDRWHPMLAFAHLADRPADDGATDPVEEVKRQAEALLGDRAKGYQPVTQDAGSAIPSEGELTFVPEIAGVEFNPPRRSFLWLEAVHREEFRMRAGAALDGKTARGRLTVFLGHIAIAEVALSVRVDRVQAVEPAAREPARARAYRKIFASYSHRDIAIVNQFETYARALGDEYLRDWIHLRTGEVWNDRLRQLIEQADAFQLFWSSNAMHSKFVRQEYEHALALNRPSFVRPTYWEDPMPTAPGLPPEALLRLHFQKLGVGIADRTVESAPTFEDHEPTAPQLERLDDDLDTMDREVTAEHAKRDEAPVAKRRKQALELSESSEPPPESASAHGRQPAPAPMAAGPRSMSARPAAMAPSAPSAGPRRMSTRPAPAPALEDPSDAEITRPRMPSIPSEPPQEPTAQPIVKQLAEVSAFERPPAIPHTPVASPPPPPIPVEAPVVRPSQAAIPMKSMFPSQPAPAAPAPETPVSPFGPTQPQQHYNASTGTVNPFKQTEMAHAVPERPIASSRPWAIIAIIVAIIAVGIVIAAILSR